MRHRVPAPAERTLVPPDVKAKLHQLMSIKEEITKAATADAAKSVAAPTHRAADERAAADAVASGGSGGRWRKGGGSGDADGAPAVPPAPPSTTDDDELCCSVCFSGPRDAVLLECGHGGICYTCALKCMRSNGPQCPICRAHVVHVVQLYPEAIASARTAQRAGVVAVKPSEMRVEDLLTC